MGNQMFLSIMIIIVFLQAILVTHGGLAIFCYEWMNKSQAGAGLDIRQWLICIVLGSGGIFWSALLKFLPEEKCCLQVFLILFILLK